MPANGIVNGLVIMSGGRLVNVDELERQLANARRISDLLCTADNSMKYGGILVIHDGKPFSTVGNMLAEIVTPNAEITGSALLRSPG